VRPTILVLNGPNLNLLGSRETALYGTATLADVEAASVAAGAALGIAVECRQSNHEGVLIDWIHAARGTVSGIVINPGGLSHTSVALMDALIAADLPLIEVHLSNIHRREAFRHHSYVSKVALGVIVGLGCHGYELAVAALGRRLLNEGQGGS
jgi:3-dehydroquinate dehydratase-2